MSIVRSRLPMAALSALVVFVGFAIRDQAGMVIALLFAFGTNLLTHGIARPMPHSMYVAHEVDETSSLELVQLLRLRAGQKPDKAGRSA